MNRHFVRSGIALLGWAIGIAAAASAPMSALDIAQMGQRISALTVPFVPNAGQWNSRTAFAAHTFAGTLFVTTEGQLVYRLPGTLRPEATPARSPRLTHVAHSPNSAAPGWVLTETLVDTMDHALPAVPRGYRPLEGRVSYAIGNDESKHRDGLPTYERVNLGDVYSGINVQLRATGGNVEKIFTIAPAHDPRAIRIRIAGTDRLEIGAEGELIAHTGNGPIVYTPPIAYQEEATGQRTSVPVRYALDTTAAIYGFAVGAYDASRVLVIDPLLQSTFLGGNGNDNALALAIHPATGEVYVAGYTPSTDFPKVAGAEQTVKGAGNDAFVTRLNAALTTRLQSTYLGGNGEDFASALAIHPATGEVYVTGQTTSTDFPNVAGAEQTAKGTGWDAFVTRFNAALTTRSQSTYLGGNGDDFGTALAIHPATGEVYVTGQTSSTDFPKVAGAEQTVKGTGNDAFVTRLNAALTTRLQSTYLGGNGDEFASGLAIHPATGEVYVAGQTSSTDFPKLAGAEQTVKGAAGDVFVTRLNAALTTRLQSSYLGGNGDDSASALAIHPATGEVYVAGQTSSTDFPKVAGAEQAVKGASNDAFVTRLNVALTARLQSTYLGGNDGDQATALAIHPATGEVYVAGYTYSTDFPKVAGAEQATHAVDGGRRDAYVTRLNAALTARLQSTYLGGNGDDFAYALAIHPATGEVYVAGYTPSTDFPKVAGAEQTVLSTPNDVFISRYSIDLLGADVVPSAFSFAPKLNVPIGSQQTSGAAQISGVVGSVPISVAGGYFAQYCISSTSGCACDVSGAWISTGSTVFNNQYVCVRQNAPLSIPAEVRATILAGGGYASFLVTTGAMVPACTLDIDGNNTIEALTDGLLIIRAMFGLTGTAVTNGALGGGATRSSWALIQPYLNGNCGASFAQ